MLRTLSALLKDVLVSLPGYWRNPQFRIMFQGGRVIWSRSSFADAVLAPAVVRTQECACGCTSYTGPRFQGHLCTRGWAVVPPASRLYHLVGNRCLSFRAYPELEVILEVLRGRVRRALLSAGVPKEEVDEFPQMFLASADPVLRKYWNTLPS